MQCSLGTRGHGHRLAGQGGCSRATARPRPEHAYGLPVRVLTLCARALGAATVAPACPWRVSNVRECGGGLGWLTGGLHHLVASKTIFCCKLWAFPQGAWLGF